MQRVGRVLASVVVFNQKGSWRVWLEESVRLRDRGTGGIAAAALGAGANARYRPVGAFEDFWGFVTQGGARGLACPGLAQVAALRHGD